MHKHLKKTLATYAIATLAILIPLAASLPIEANQHATKQNEEQSIKDRVAFGNLASPIEIYLFSDWQCPACRKAEPRVEAMAPKVMDKARFTFVDTVVHEETLNFIPFNLAFMIHNKADYFRLRHKLTELSLETGSPTEEQVEQAIAPVKLQQLHYADVGLGTDYFKHLVVQFDIEATPTMVIVNKETKKGKKLGGSEITEENVLKAIDYVSN